MIRIGILVCKIYETKILIQFLSISNVVDKILRKITAYSSKNTLYLILYVT